MKVGRGAWAAHLSYCTNIHPGESWAETRRNLGTYLPPLKARLSPEADFGIGLRLSARAAAELVAPGALEQALDDLGSRGLYVYTVNGFPYGTFHGQPVKEQVYLPDWRAPERLEYTDLLADLLAQLLPAGMAGSISTVPVAFRRTVEGEADLERAAQAMLRHVAHLVQIERRTGVKIALAIEPEPCCWLETTPETVTFFEQHLLSPAGLSRLAREADIAPGPRTEEAVRRHLGVCLDLCHAAVEFEDPVESLAALRRAGISIPKVQLSAGLRVVHVTPSTVARLRDFQDDVFLHQVVERRSGDPALRRYEDLHQAFAAFDADPAADREWRVHFHVPIFHADLGEFQTTRDAVETLLRAHRRAPVSAHFEVETYTFGVLPAQYRGSDVVTSIEREVRWAAEQFA